MFYLPIFWPIIILILMAIFSLAFRIPKEEKMLNDEFGDEYRDYMHTTSRLIPKI